MPDLDPFHPDRVAAEVPARLQAFNDAGVLTSADIHTAQRLARLTGCTDDDAVLGAAFAVRATRFGHVFAQLDELRDTVTDDDGRVTDLDPAAWPDDLDAWVEAIAASPMVRAHPEPSTGPEQPLHLDGTRLYLDRYWRYEHRVAAHVRDRLTTRDAALTLDQQGRAVLRDRVGADPAQHAAAVAALTTPFTVIAGGPGTGKTWVIAQTVSAALSHTTRAGGQPPRIAIAAPTGKAAARLGEQLRESDRAAAGIRPTTLHRLLGWRPNRTRFRHDADNPLPFDLVIVDEVSMVSLAMLSSLMDALDRRANLVLVGDPDQLAAVEAGTVLGDLVIGAGPSSAGADSPEAPDAAPDHPGPVITLDRGYRFDDRIKAFSWAVRDGDAAAALAALTIDPADLADEPLALVVPERPGEWPDRDPALVGLRQVITAETTDVIRHAVAGDAASAMQAALAVKVLCAHRRGPEGVGVWNATIEGWIHDLPSYRRPEWYPGRPVMVTGNDHDLGVYNGDLGVVVAGPDGSRQVVIDGRSGGPIEHRRLGDIQTVHAMTVHKSQGSQLDRVVVVLPSEPSPVLTRELLYTAVTRAKQSVVIVGSPDVLAETINRPVSRASALPERIGLVDSRTDATSAATSTPTKASS